MSRIEICKAQPCHVPAIARLEALCFSQPWPEDMIARLRERFSVAVEDGQVLGYGALSWVLDEGSLDNIAVEPACRRKGVAQALLDDMVAQAKTQALAFITLEVRQHNEPAISLYAKNGFQVVGRRKNYYEKPREDAILMTLTLEGRN
jgi:ribosomal-protein-alanine N-acetyltransferase